MEDGRQVGDSCIFLPSVTQLLEELSSLVSKAHKKGERKKKENPACIDLSLLCADCAAERKEETI